MLPVVKINEPVSLLDDHVGGLMPGLLHQLNRDNSKMVFLEEFNICNFQELYWRYYS